MTDVILYGELGKKYGKRHSFVINSIPEAFRALDCNYPGFIEDIKKDSYYKVVADNKVLDESQLGKQVINSIKIIPIVQGSGNGVGNIIAGAALLTFAWYNPFSWGWLANASSLGAIAVKTIGVSLLLGGVSQLLTKTTKTKTVDTNPSYVFNGAVNTSSQGNPVPLAYGKILAGSQVISTGLEAR